MSLIIVVLGRQTADSVSADDDELQPAMNKYAGGWRFTTSNCWLWLVLGTVRT